MVTADMLSILGATHEDMADVLSGLGYRRETLAEEDVVAKLAEWDPLKEEAASDETAAAPANPDDTATAEKTDGQSDETQSAKPDEPEEPKTVNIWRPARSGSPKRAQGRNDNRSRGKGPKGGRQQHQGKPNRKPRPPVNKEPDPDSPFAKLAALKQNLSGDNG